MGIFNQALYCRPKYRIQAIRYAITDHIRCFFHRLLHFVANFFIQLSQTLITLAGKVFNVGQALLSGNTRV